MKRFLFVLLLFIANASFVSGADFCVEPYSSKPTETELSFANRWVAHILGQGEGDVARYGADLPFSFRCGERLSRDWVKPGGANVESAEWTDEGTRHHTLTWKDPESSVVCVMELTEFKDFPGFQYIIKLRNDGTENTEVFCDFRSLETDWNAEGDVMPILHRAVGSPGAENDFEMRDEIMHSSMWKKSRSVLMNESANRAASDLGEYFLRNDKRSSAVWLPFFNYQTGDDGLLIGLGWSGRWNADFSHLGEGRSVLRTGLGNFKSYLKPGEEVRSPLTLVLYWRGEFMRAQNMFRQIVLKHYSPKIDGKIVEPPVSGLVWGGVPSKEHLEIIEKLKEFKIPLDVYWFDAGWYGTGTVPSYTVFQGDWGPMCGDWRPNPNWHNGTLTPVSDAAKKAGYKFLVWVEPCRAVHGVPPTLEHPELFLGKTVAGEQMLLDIGNEKSCQYAIDVVSDLIEKYNIDWYEEDFNIEPAIFLEPLDEPDRTGMREIRFVEGHFKFWDALLKRFPHLAILNCASGGRRIDLETIKRGQPLWRSDYNCFPEATPEATQDQCYNIAYWLPIQGTMIRGWMIFDHYEALSGLSPGAENGLVAKNDEEWKQIKENVLLQKACKKYFFGDFYPLVHTQGAQDSWMAYSLFLHDEQEGMLLAMRREKSDVVSMTFDLTTIDPEANWTFRDYDTGETWTLQGREIREKGLEVKIPERRSAKLLFYSRE